MAAMLNVFHLRRERAVSEAAPPLGRSLRHPGAGAAAPGAQTPQARSAMVLAAIGAGSSVLPDR